MNSLDLNQGHDSSVERYARWIHREAGSRVKFPT